MFRICLDDDCHKMDDCLSCQRNALIICFLINFSMFLVEIFYGLTYNSSALLGDSADNIGDALILGSSVFLLGSTLLAKARLALIKSALMFIIGFVALIHVVTNLYTGYVPAGMLITRIGIFVLIGNVASACLLLYYRKQDVYMRSAYICCRNDAIYSVSIIIAGIAVTYTNSSLPDIAIGSAIAFFIMWSALTIGKESLDVIKDIKQDRA